jgi:general secretion pathway protein A
MNKVLMASLLGIAIMSTFCIRNIYAGDKEELIATAMIEYLISARAVIAQNQNLINDSSKGDKGFTPAVYEQQVRQEFLKRSDTDLFKIDPVDDFGKALNAIHRAAKEIVAEAQPQINQTGKAFKGFNPAAFGARTGEKLKSYSNIRIKQTSLHFRATYNKPDEYEAELLKKFEKGDKDQKHAAETTLNGDKVFRAMTPLYIAKSCLNCHGDPAGDVDVSGHKKEGYKDGELRGAISIVVPVQ